MQCLHDTMVGTLLYIPSDIVISHAKIYASIVIFQFGVEVFQSSRQLGISGHLLLRITILTVIFDVFLEIPHTCEGAQ